MIITLHAQAVNMKPGPIFIDSNLSHSLYCVATANIPEPTILVDSLPRGGSRKPRGDSRKPRGDSRKPRGDSKGQALLQKPLPSGISRIKKRAAVKRYPGLQ